MKKNVVYFLGAGASAQALPVINSFNDRLFRFLEHLKKSSSEHSINITTITQDCEFILSESKKHSTIDTVAKKFFHSYNSKKKELLSLKKVLTLFFCYEQCSNYLPWINQDASDIDNGINRTLEKKGRIDPRYDAFIASLLKPDIQNIKLPENVSVVTWNYDFQFELALQEFYPELSFTNIQKQLNVYPVLNTDKEY